MKPKCIHDYVIFGTGFRYLQDAKEGYSIHGDGRVLEVIDRYLKNLELLDLSVTKNASHKLIEFYEEIKTKPPKSRLTKEEATRLAEIIRDCRKTLFAELQGKFGFVVTDKRYAIDKLLNNPNLLLATNIFENLPDIAQYDFSEACKCLAFERPTAAAFHLLRSCESVLREYYKTYVKRERISEPYLWGKITDDLKKKKRKEVPGELLDNLDIIRRNYRNPTDHPEKCYDIDQVQDLFGLYLDVTNRMIKQMKKIK